VDLYWGQKVGPARVQVEEVLNGVVVVGHVYKLPQVHVSKVVGGVSVGAQRSSGGVGVQVREVVEQTHLS
jgi:RNA-splicing ligase RtcB